MTRATAVRAVRAERLDIPLKRPFGIATGAQHACDNVLVTVELEDGTLGRGEAAPFEAVSGETQAALMDAIPAAARALVGRDAREWRALASEMKPALPRTPSLRCALETALLDALLRRARMPFWAFFGGASTTLETDITVTTGGVDDAKNDAAWAASAGFATIKTKVGGADLDLDVARVRAIRAAAPSARILLDGNTGFDASGAIELLERLARAGIRPALFEQPVGADDLAGLKIVNDTGLAPVCADESVASVKDAVRVIDAHAVSAINIKLMKSGIVDGLAIAALARAHGVALMIGGMIESILAMSASAGFAAGLGGFEFVDLDTPLFLASNPFDGGFAQDGRRLDVGRIDAGHGVTPR